MDEDLSRFCCQNERCPDYGKRGLGNLTVCARYGKHKQRRLLYCRTCKAPVLRAQGDAPVRLATARGEGPLGLRSTWPSATASGPPPDWSKREPQHRRPLQPLGRRPRPATPRRVRGFFPRAPGEVQFDEKWSFVFKKQEHCDPDDPADDHRGDWWDHVAYDPEHRLVLCVVPGARDAESVEEVVDEVKQRTGGRVLDLMTSDGYPAYETAILDAYGQEVTTTPTGRASRRMAPARRSRRRG